MPDAGELFPRSAIRAALAREAYHRGEVRLADPDLSGYQWLVASPEGVFAVRPDQTKKVVYGRFFGICRHGEQVLLFEKCADRGEATPYGRIVRFDIAGDALTAPAVLATGLDNQCHQLAVIDGYICVVDTAHQAIARFGLDGRPIDLRRPLPPGEPGDASGAYTHMNSIAEVGDRIVLMLHNGGVRPEKQSELAWLDRDWVLLERQPIPGHSCHDIVEDERGVLWHSASRSGEIISSDGARVKITNELMTRGIAITPEAMIVGMSTFGPRHIRDRLRGGLVILDRGFNQRVELELRGAPTDIIAI